jgi:phosphatidylinositol 4-phosphatase
MLLVLFYNLSFSSNIIVYAIKRYFLFIYPLFMPYLLYHKHSQKITYQSDSGSICINKKNQNECVDDIIENINFDFLLGIIKIENVEYLGVVKESELIGIYEGNDIYKIIKVDFLPFGNVEMDDTPFYLEHFIHSNDFYISKDKFCDDEFVWNMHMQNNFFNAKHKSDSNLKIKHCPDLNRQNYLIGHMICGYFVNKTFKIDQDFYNMKLLSLVSSNKMGTRLLSRGIDIDGNVSFFVKTTFECKKNIKVLLSLTVIRGSVPLFWKQKNKGINGKLYFTGNRKDLETSFDKHFNKLEKTFGKVHVITLLGEKKDEKILNDAYIDLLSNKNIKHTVFDLNSHTHEFDNLKNLFFWHLNKIDTEDLVYRVNCIDCLDRTNLAQFLICKFRLDKILKDPKVDLILQECWTENGNSLSNLYTGSDVMKKELSLKQKRSFMGLFDDLLISATRLINNRFTDKQKNKMINILLGKYDTSKNDDNV